MLKTCCPCSNSSCRKKAVAYGIRVDAWGPVAMAALIMYKGQARPKEVGQPGSAYFLSIRDAG